MKRTSTLMLFLALLSAMSGYMMSKASWVGKLGMSLFYKEYNFLKIWWQGALLVFGVLLFVFIIQTIIQKTIGVMGRVAQAMILVAVASGLYLSYHDFRHNFSHRLLGERFHIGVYLFWLGWIIICLYHLFSKSMNKAIIASDSKDEVKPQNP